MDNTAIHGHAGPSTPSRQQRHDVDMPKFENWLEEFERKYQIRIRPKSDETPASAVYSTASDTLKQVRLLFYRDYGRLSRILSEFDRIRAKTTSKKASIEWLEQKLITAYKETKETMQTPNSESRKKSPNSLPIDPIRSNIFSGDIPTTPSPMRQINIGSKYTSFSTTCATETSIFSQQGRSEPLLLDTEKSSDFLSTPKEQISRSESVHVKSIAQVLSKHIDLPPSMHHLELYMQIEYLRAIQSGLDISKLTAGAEVPQDISALHNRIAKDEAIHIERFQEGFKTDFSNAIMCASLQWGQKIREPVLSLKIMRPKKQMSNSIRRRFGGSRFLSVDVPALPRPPKSLSLNGQEAFIEHRVLEFFARDKLNILGCEWRFLHIKPVKNGSTAKNGAFKAIFFATTVRDPRMEHISLQKVVEWAVPLVANSTQTACKAFVRLDLVMTNTMKGLILDPSQIDYDIKDVRAIDVSDRTEFDDKCFSGRDYDQPLKPLEKDREITNDGCNWISTYAMNELRLKLNWHFLPSAIQARIYGAKGIWYRDHELDPLKRPSKLLAISNSQIKVKPNERNPFNATFGLDLSINIKKYSQPVKSSSVLYLDFIPILVDRGVSPDTICKLAGRLTTRDIDGLIEALADRQQLRSWFHARDYMGDSEHEYDEAYGKVPLTDSQRIGLMLDVGFEPNSCSYLRKEISNLANRIFALNKRTFRIPLPRSANVLGIADPFGCLKPGEIYLNFTNALLDAESGLSWTNLQGMNVLVARNPALRNSDVQKVRAVYKGELAHFLDVVVFPSAARRSLAGKLQGGDYDGDIFWVCWQPELVKDFKNAPAPYAQRKAEELGISVDETTLKEALNIKNGHPIGEQAISNWLVDQAKNRMAQDFLGQVTNMYRKVVYHENNLNSPKAMILADLHDHLVDAEKQGYRFDQKAWSKFKRDHGILNNLPKPSYQICLDGDENPRYGLMLDRGRNDNILDRVVLQTVAPMFQKRLKDMDKRLGGNGRLMKFALGKFYDDTVSCTRSDEVQADLKTMLKRLGEFQKVYSSAMDAWKHGKSDWSAAIARCQEFVDAIEPQHPENDVMREWLRRHGHAPTIWELLRASAMVKRYGDEKNVFRVVWYELCILQARLSDATFEIHQKSYANLKPRALRKQAGDEDEDDIADDGIFDDVDGMSDEDFGDSSGFDELAYY